jgi:hypothetical protein
MKNVAVPQQSAGLVGGILTRADVDDSHHDAHGLVPAPRVFPHVAGAAGVGRGHGAAPLTPV